MSLFQLGGKGGKGPPGYDDPAGMLTHCHVKIEMRLASLPKICEALRARDPEAKAALAAVVQHFDTAGVKHTEDEEFSVFPRLSSPAARALIDKLDAEHREHEAIYLAFRTVAKKSLDEDGDVVGELEQHAAALSSAYREHIALEERDLIPEVKALASPELRAIGLEMRMRRGGAEPQR
jgi:hemerythrin-like domain-containing protein